jgi:Na+/H+ antiporter NhaD/arsenite permease-like protein
MPLLPNHMRGRMSDLLICCVQVVDCHGGFKRLASWVTAEERSSLAWSIAVLTFFMSAVLDNLTTTIVMVSILQASDDHCTS